MPTNPPQQAVMYAGEAPSWGLMVPPPAQDMGAHWCFGSCINLNLIFAGLVEGPADTVGVCCLEPTTEPSMFGSGGGSRLTCHPTQEVTD